jgi:hypothetical protein
MASAIIARSQRRTAINVGVRIGMREGACVVRREECIVKRAAVRVLGRVGT